MNIEYTSRLKSILPLASVWNKTTLNTDDVAGAMKLSFRENFQPKIVTFYSIQERVVKDFFEALYIVQTPDITTPNL